MIDAEPEEDETREKLRSETNATVFLVSDAELNSDESGAPVAEAAAGLASCHPFATPLQDEPKISDESFKVYLKRSEKPTFISVEDYRKQELDDINHLDEGTKIIYKCQTIARLEKMGVVKKDCEELAQELMDGRGVKFKAGPDSEEHAKEYYIKKKELKSYQCLLISAPRTCKQVDSLEQQEMRNFCLQAFPPKLFDAADMEDLRVCHEVSRPEQIGELIHGFFRGRDRIRAKRALHAVIVFFGHGCEKGFCIGEEGRVPLDNIISAVKNEWVEALKTDPKWLPVRVKIIFAHCYGHLHPKYDKDFKIDRFKVISFTDDEHPLAYAVQNAEGKYYVKQLKEYVENHLLPEIIAVEALRIENKQNEETEPGDSSILPVVIDSGLAVASTGIVARRGKAGTHGELQGRVHD